jgi:hypothetical protein
LAGDGKKNDATVPIVLIIGGFLLLLLFGGCGQISLPTFNTGSGYPNSNSPQCDSRRSDCRGHYDGNGQWIPDQNAGRDQNAGGNERHGSAHQRRRHRPTDDPDR